MNHPDASPSPLRQAGRTLVREVMCPDPYAMSHLVLAMREAGEVATSGEAKNITKYAELARTHHVTPLAIETSRVFGEGLMSFPLSWRDGRFRSQEIRSPDVT